MQIIFRRLDDNIPHGWVAGIRWIVEAYPDGACNLPFPMGQAWVSDYTPKGDHCNLTSLDFILVADQYRRHGVAKELYKVILERWPNIIVTDAISKSGEGFLNNVEPWRITAAAAQNKEKYELRKKERKRKKLARQRRK